MVGIGGGLNGHNKSTVGISSSNASPVTNTQTISPSAGQFIILPTNAKKGGQATHV